MEATTSLTSYINTMMYPFVHERVLRESHFFSYVNFKDENLS